MAAGPVPQLSPLQLVAFCCLATFAQALLAGFGLLSRYVQVVSSPPLPALRLVVIVSLLAEATMVVFHVLPFWAAPRAAAWLRTRLSSSMGGQARRELPTSKVSSSSVSEVGKPPSTKQDSNSSSKSVHVDAQALDSGMPDLEQQQQPAPAGSECEQLEQQQQQQAVSSAGQPALAEDATAPAPPAAGGGPQPLARTKSTARAPVPLLRGLSRKMEDWEDRRPRLHRRLVLAALTVSFMGVCSLQLLAPGWVDVSIVQLTTQWTTLCIALTQALLLRNALPRTFWPCAVVLLAGSTMVIVPSIGQSTSGSLSTIRGWCGFIAAIGALISTVTYFTLLQATRHMGFTPIRLQHYLNLFSLLVFLPLSLPIDGTDWNAQFAGWTAADWAVLAVLSSACYIGSGMLMQICVWKLGAPMAAMFFGLRLVFAVALSTPILGTTVIKTGVQIAGVAITALAVTVYAALQWQASRKAHQQAQSAAAAAAAAAAVHEAASSDCSSKCGL